MTSELTLLIWPDYINPLTLEQFEREQGIQVKLEIVPSAAELIERMRAPGPAVDVLTPPDYAVRELAVEGRLLTLDHQQLPNLAHLEPRFRIGRPHDPESRVSAVKDWGTTGFMYRTDKIAASPRRWSDFWELARQHSGQATVLDAPGEVIGAALKMRGYSYNEAAPDALVQARTALLALKPHLLAFDTNYRPLLAAGEAWLALGWNGDAAALLAQGVPVRYVVPEEGSQIWEDDWAIAASAPNSAAAHAFLNFVLRPETAAQEARYTRYATGNQAAFDLLETELQNDPATYPAAGVLSKLEAGMPLDADGTRRREVLWKTIRG